jgi:hypothetical protein
VDLLRDVVVTRKRPTWLFDNLHDVEGHETPCGIFRERKRHKRFSSYMALISHIVDSKPSSYEEETHQKIWKDAMMEEYHSIMKNDVWEVILRLEGKLVLTSKWIYKIKHASYHNIKMYIVGFVARGFSQKEGVDYEETFTQVSRYTSIRTIISHASFMGWKSHQMDVKTVFCNGVIEEEVYIEKPQDFVIHGKESHVCILNKVLYGLK